jgi:alpha-ketoglutarate-dependent taurine dioxygenase
MTGSAPGFDVHPDGPLQVIEGRKACSPLAVDQKFLEAEFARSGALLLRGFEFDVETFRQFAERLCSASVFNESRNRALIDRSSNIQSVDLGTAPFPLHPELSREPWRPDACLFACFGAPSRGGETTVCDGVEIVRRLPPALVSEMLAHNLLYCQPALPEALEFWLGTSTPSAEVLASPPPQCPYSFTKSEDRIIRCFSRPVLHKPMFHDGPAFGNFLLFARLALRVPHFPLLEDGRAVPDAWVEAVRQAAAPITYALRWRAGDILIIDNSRFMHGRNAILNTAERKIASYFGYLSFAPPNEYDPPDARWRRGAFRPPARRQSPASTVGQIHKH